VTVRDTVAPTLLVNAVPDRLQPPDGRLAPVVVGITTGDLCDAEPIVTLESITSNDPKFDPDADVSDASYGTADRVLLLRARRTGGIGGRIYTLTYAATDHSGNSAGATTDVLVPQGQGK